MDRTRRVCLEVNMLCEVAVPYLRIDFLNDFETLLDDMLSDAPR